VPISLLRSLTWIAVRKKQYSFANYYSGGKVLGTHWYIKDCNGTVLAIDILAKFSASVKTLEGPIISASLYERRAIATGVSPGPSVGPHKWPPTSMYCHAVWGGEWSRARKQCTRFWW